MEFRLCYVKNPGFSLRLVRAEPKTLCAARGLSLYCPIVHYPSTSMRRFNPTLSFFSFLGTFGGGGQQSTVNPGQTLLFLSPPFIPLFILFFSCRSPATEAQAAATTSKSTAETMQERVYMQQRHHHFVLCL